MLNLKGQNACKFFRSCAVSIICIGVFSNARAQLPIPASHDFEVVTVAEGLISPWSMALLPNGDMLVTELGGTLRMIRNGELLPDPVEGVPAVQAVGQGGMQEVAVHPEFDSNQFVYLSYSKPNADNSMATTALMRARLVRSRLVDAVEIYEATAWSDAPGHYGARIAFDDEGYLYMSVGDRMAGLSLTSLDQGMDPDLTGHPSQDPSTTQGSIIRLHDDGTIPQDNPFVGRAGLAPEVWSYGHRNPQGLAFQPGTGVLFSTEHGPQGGDELNLIRRGANYGWPVIGYGANYVTGTEIHASRYRGGMEQPAAFWTPSIGISGLLFYQGDQFPNWQGDAFVAGMAGDYQRLVRIAFDGQIVTYRQPLLVGEFRIRDVREGPDGYIYLALDDTSGQPSNIVRLEPVDE